ncbi:MAG: hypothetical protein HUU02_08850 [Bacteroidetes bacterium]|nr:hypothetical protein [Bacteroidota bacterium]
MNTFFPYQHHTAKDRGCRKGVISRPCSAAAIPADNALSPRSPRTI